jgi:glutamate dehydrogenase
VPEELARAHAYLPALAYAPDVISAAASVGRSRRGRRLAFSLLEDRVQIAWIEEQLDELPVSTRMQRWALQALRDDLWRARRELACKALNERPGRSVEDAVERFVEAHPDAMRGCRASPERSPSRAAADLAGLTLAVRQLRALAD